MFIILYDCSWNVKQEAQKTMSVTKQEIVRSATKLFSERGFLAASIQDIADDCQIAKGSVYKYFPSKEDLFNEVFDQCQSIFFEQAERLKLVPGRPPKDRFVQQIIFRLQYFMDYKFVLVDFKELPVQQNDKFVPLRLRARGKFMNWHKECLLQVYGQAIEANIWDLVMILKAMLKEYIYWILKEEKPISVEETAAFIADKIDVLARHLIAANPPVLFRETFIASYIEWGMEGRAAQKDQVVAELLDNLFFTISELPSGNAYRQELQEIAHLCRAEFVKKEPNRPLLQALLAYLEQEHELKSLVKQIRNLLMHWK